MDCAFHDLWRTQRDRDQVERGAGGRRKAYLAEFRSGSIVDVCTTRRKRRTEREVVQRGLRRRRPSVEAEERRRITSSSSPPSPHSLRCSYSLPLRSAIPARSARSTRGKNGKGRHLIFLCSLLRQINLPCLILKGWKLPLICHIVACSAPTGCRVMDQNVEGCWLTPAHQDHLLK